MPVMDGLRFVEQLRETKPDAADTVILMSGSIEGPISGLRMLQKPVRWEQVRTLLKAH